MKWRKCCEGIEQIFRNGLMENEMAAESSMKKTHSNCVYCIFVTIGSTSQRQNRTESKRSEERIGGIKWRKIVCVTIAYYTGLLCYVRIVVDAVVVVCRITNTQQKMAYKGIDITLCWFCWRLAEPRRRVWRFVARISNWKRRQSRIKCHGAYAI